MIKFNMRNPKSIDNETDVKIRIEYNGETYEIGALNIFGGIITDYEKGSPATCVIPFGMGEITPGMLLSHVSALLTCAMQLTVRAEIPKHILRDIAHVAIEEGLR